MSLIVPSDSGWTSSKTTGSHELFAEDGLSPHLSFSSLSETNIFPPRRPAYARERDCPLFDCPLFESEKGRILDRFVKATDTIATTQPSCCATRADGSR